MFEYLKKYRVENYSKEHKFEAPWNRFKPVSAEEINSAETILGYKLPHQLCRFYLEVGYGELQVPHNPPRGYNFYGASMFLHPIAAANFVKGELAQELYEAYMLPDAYDVLEPEELPFFEICDSEGFLFVKPLSDKPNAVWDHQGIVAPSLEEFVHRLYYEGPSFYYNITKDMNSKKK